MRFTSRRTAIAGQAGRLGHIVTPPTYRPPTVDSQCRADHPISQPSILTADSVGYNVGLSVAGFTTAPPEYSIDSLFSTGVAQRSEVDVFSSVSLVVNAITSVPTLKNVTQCSLRARHAVQSLYIGLRRWKVSVCSLVFKL